MSQMCFQLNTWQHAVVIYSAWYIVIRLNCSGLHWPLQIILKLAQLYILACKVCLADLRLDYFPFPYRDVLRFIFIVLFRCDVMLRMAFLHRN